MSKQPPFVSVWMITYNHGDYVRKAIEGVMAQITHFDYELVIGDDGSTDNTVAIIMEYQQKYPNIVKTRLSKINEGMMKNVIRTLEDCNGKYIAMCEGDDYWIDSNKLQKQVDFLEKHNEYILCAHTVKEIDSTGREIRLLKPEELKESYSFFDININITLWTCSYVFRNIIDKYPKWMLESPYGDLPLVLLLSMKGKIKFLDEPMTVYRNNGLGVHSSASHMKKITTMIKASKFLEKHFPKDYRQYFPKLRSFYLNLLSREVNYLVKEEKFTEARSGLYVMLSEKPKFSYLSQYKIKTLMSVLIGTKIWLFIMMLKGKKRLIDL